MGAPSTDWYGKWYVSNKDPSRAKGRGTWDIAANGTHLAESRSEEIADQIVCAVNAHDALVGALRAIVDTLADSPRPWTPQQRNAHAIATDALALAAGEGE
jgi:hypothetical protein